MKRIQLPIPAQPSRTQDQTTQPSELSNQSLLGGTLSPDEKELYGLILQLVSVSGLQNLLNEILRAVIEIQGADFGSVQLYNPESGALEIAAHRGFRQEFLNHFHNVVDATSICGRAMRLMARVAVEDVNADAAFQPHRQIAAAAGFRAVQCTPLFCHDGELLAMVSTHFRQPLLPTQRKLELTDLYLRIAGQLIKHDVKPDRLPPGDEQLRMMLNSSPNPIFLKDTDGRFLFVNDALSRILDLDPAQCVGRRDNDIFGPNCVSQVRPNDLEVLRSCKTREFERGVTLQDGLHTYIVQEFPLRDAVGKIRGVAGIGADVSRLRQAEADLRALLGITRKINSSLDPDELLDSLVVETIRLVGAESGCAGLNTPAGLSCRKYFQKSKFIPLKYCWPPMQGLPGWVLVHKRPYVTNDASNDAQIVRGLCERFHVRSAISTPLVSQGGEVIGFFEIHNKKAGKAFTDEDVQRLLAVSQAASVAVENSLTHKRIRIAEEALLEATTNTLVSNLDLPALLNAISTWLCRITPYDDIRLALFESGNTQLREWILRPSDPEKPFQETDIPVERATSGWVSRSGQPLVFNRLKANRHPSELLTRLVVNGLRSACLLPLATGQRVFGLLCFASGRGNDFRADTVDFLSQVADRIAVAVRETLALRQSSFEEIVGKSAALTQVLNQVETVASTDATVLLLGETGTGKERIARTIHNLSNRRDKRLITVNCATIPAALMESELFGHEKGAFTGATSRKTGRVELAHEGTLFLDEVGDIPLELQPKLLRLLQEHEFERLGGTQTMSIDVRVIAATNRDLAQMVAERRFRGDLFYRLNVFPIVMPPLRERPEDIPQLVHHFVEKSCQRLNKHIDRIPEKTLQALSHCQWPGNVRELENFIERAVILSRGPVLEISARELASRRAASSALDRASTLSSADRKLILRALQESRGIVGGPSGAAARLGMKRTTLNARMRKLGITRRDVT